MAKLLAWVSMPAKNADSHLALRPTAAEIDVMVQRQAMGVRNGKSQCFEQCFFCSMCLLCFFSACASCVCATIFQHVHVCVCHGICFPAAFSRFESLGGDATPEARRTVALSSGLGW